MATKASHDGPLLKTSNLSMSVFTRLRDVLLNAHPLPPAIALMTLVLGLNLLADGLGEERLKD